MKKKSQALLLLIFSFIFLSCKRELHADNPSAKISDQLSLSASLTEQETNNLWDQRVHEVASIISRLLRGREFREYLKGKSIEAFDGDYDVLLSTIVSDIVASQGSTNPLVVNENFITDEQVQYLQKASEEFPQMQISVQVDPETWSTVSYLPPVVYTGSDYDENTTPRVPVVDEKGTIIRYMDARVDPTDPVVIVSMNERTDIIDGRVELRQDPRPEGVEGAEKVDSLSPIDPTIPVQWYRPNFKYETVDAIGFWDIGKIEGFPAGGPELRVFHYSATDSSGTTYSKDGIYAGERWAKRKDVKNKWYSLPTEKLITNHLWRWGQTGTVFKYGFYEFDREPFNQAAVDSIASFVTKFAKVDSNGNLINPAQYAAIALQLVGLFLPKEGRLSEFIGEMEISANNNANEFHIATGGFGFRSKPY